MLGKAGEKGRAEIRMFQRRIEEEKYDLLREVDLVEILSFRSDSI